MRSLTAGPAAVRAPTAGPAASHCGGQIFFMVVPPAGDAAGRRDREEDGGGWEGVEELVGEISRKQRRKSSHGILFTLFFIGTSAMIRYPLMLP